MRKTIAPFALLFLAGVAPSAAVGAEARQQIALSASIGSFCRLSLDRAVVGPNGEIGVVREVCNEPAGYAVTVTFDNLAQGVMVAGTERVAVGDGGLVRLERDRARLATASWSLAEARRADPSRPIEARLSITPR